MLPFLIENMGLSYFLGGLIITVANIVSSITQPAIGLYSDKTGWRASIPLCILIGSIGICLTALTNNYYVLLILVVGAAIGSALFHPSAMDLMYKLSPPEKRGLYNSIFTTSGSISYSLGPLIAGAIITYFGMPAIFWMIIPGIIGAAWVYRFGRKENNHIREIPEPNKISKETEKKKYWWVPAGLVVTICSLRAWAYVGIITYLPTLLILVYKEMDTLTASIIVTIMLFFGVAGQVAGGWFSDKFGRKKMLIYGLIAAVPFFAMIFMSSGILMYLGIMMYSFFACFCYVTSVTMTQELLPGKVGFASGLTLGLSMGIGGVGAALIGYLADTMNSLPDAMFLLIVPVIICPILAIFVKYPNEKRNEALKSEA
jgi:Arabinose efflux permease